MIFEVRRADISDLDEITSIYNEAILKTNATFDTVPKTVEEQTPWFHSHGDQFPIIVATENRIVVGWGSLSPWSGRCAYSETAENSVYVAHTHQGKGIGKKLLQALLIAARKQGLHTVIARITEGNDVSVKLHEKQGFQTVGIMREVGKKLDQRLDVRIMQVILGK